jgi:cytochrome c
MKISRLYLALFVVAAFGFSACGDENTEGTDNAASDSTMTMEAAPSMEAQIGPVTELELGAYDAVLAATGEAAFTAKCTACHNLDTKVIGPALGGVLDRRSPVYVINMILNPTGMLESHPDAQAMLAEYAVPMVPLGIEEAEARAIVEFLRGEG